MKKIINEVVIMKMPNHFGRRLPHRERPIMWLENKSEVEFVKSISEIKNNIRVVDNYLESHDNQEVDYAKELIRKGICFITVADENGYRFYPSKFMGYANNNMDTHEREKNIKRSGIETNDVISGLLGAKPKFDENLEEKYKDYCEFLGFEASKRKRKYWLLSE